MPLDLGGAYGLANLQASLRQRVADKLAQQHQIFQDQIAARAADRADQQQQILMQQHQATMADLAQQRAEAEATKGTAGLSVNQSIPAPMAARLRSTMQAANIQDNPPLAQPPIEGMMQPDIVPGQQPGAVWLGNDQQRTGEENKVLRGRLLANPAISARERLAIEMENAGLKVPGGVFEPKPADNANAEDRRYEDIIARKSQQLPIAPNEAAWAQAYEKRKTLGPAVSSAAADTRLASQQDFQVQQAGRRELTDKVEKPFQDAQAQAATLRDIVTSARAGNKFAAAQQPLEATLATVRQAGLNRINTVELGVAAKAGSLWDRIQGAIGRQTAGQPMDAELQQNLLDYADVLEKAAHKRYLTGHKQITTRYKLTDEPPMAGPASPAAHVETWEIGPDGIPRPKR